MKKALKELIENAPVKRKGKFTELMFVSNGKCDGFYGPNGFNKMIIFGKNVESDETTWYKIVSENDECDKFDIYSQDIPRFTGYNLDIPAAYGCPRIWFTNYYFKIDYSFPLSSIVAELERR